VLGGQQINKADACRPQSGEAALFRVTQAGARTTALTRACPGAESCQEDPGMKHRFGGEWTEQKLEVLRKYLDFFPRALGGSKFELVYIDTFAGNGKCTIKTGPSGERTIEGSATIALNTKRPFDRYFFIEQRRKFVRGLEALKASHPMGERISITHGDATEHLAHVLSAINWRSTRGVLFLDPYGLQCTWEMVKRVAATQALDVFFLVSISGLTRQAAKIASNIDSDKQAALDRFLGTASWREALYRPPNQRDIFDSAPSHEREAGTEAIVQFVHDQLESVFPYVAPPLILKGPNNAPLYALFFAVSNPGQKALSLAGRVSRDVLSNLH
jgi:three-Cys-motif partner protein